jgi:putative heme-binding domain-containing protein
VMNAIEAGDLAAASCSAIQRSALETCRDGTVAARARAAFASLIASAEDRLPAYLDACARPRDAPRGAELFRTNCGVCHRAHGEGVAVGPDLDGEARQPDETLLLSILAPSARIAGGYTTYTVLTRDGRVASGLLAADTATSVTLLGQAGKSHTILRQEIDEITASPVSLMPESLASTLTPDDVADILAWLRD